MIEVKQYDVILMNSKGIKTHRVNCSSESSAMFICMGLFGDMRIIDIIEIMY